MGKVEQDYRNKFNRSHLERKKTGSEGQSGSRKAIEKGHRHPQSLGVSRWAMGREDQKPIGSSESYDRFMQFWVNPAECSWSVGLRSALDRTAGGMVHHEIAVRGRNISRLELPALTIAFQSGIITPDAYNHMKVREVASQYPPSPPTVTDENAKYSEVLSHGLANFYDFLDLLDRPNVTESGTPNYVNIYYVSPTFSRRGVWLQGFFDESGVSWTDSSNNPTTITGWTASFTVFQANPPLNRLRNSFKTG